jgi:hypothetical protein
MFIFSIHQANNRHFQQQQKKLHFLLEMRTRHTKHGRIYFGVVLERFNQLERKIYRKK